MDKNKIQVNELNRLYDEIYYSNNNDVEQALELISNLISEKEYEESGIEVNDLSDIIHIAIETLEEISEIFDSEGLIDSYNFVIEKLENLQNGELDDIIEEEYSKFFDDDFIDEYGDESEMEDY
ncbi:hypothetical protein SAMN02745135_02484 [Caloranaerobacter azorensis DSM 13643]|uniref:Uncharacterized protein n=1 Tax=Caloranaerobacter azorensis DSM 13643 TaxID=1121264 RepID=A0A1M5WHI3_9FIRM|nr:hypothetical protein [Caloranaerobacter azorensis]SHH86999.1 hypothetical protein SAMN02745135_02484 [Caloranaerobacter azorensis DSM 13643]